MTDRPNTTALYTLRALQVGLKLSDLDEMTFGLVMDIITESNNDNCEWQQLANQDDFDKF